MASTVERAEYASLQELLKQSRERKGLSQRGLSAKLGKMASYIQKIESGERRVDVIEFLQICDLLEIDESAFLRELRVEIATARKGNSNKD